jgi:hypothetical protein
MDKIKIENSEDGTIKKKVESFFSNKKPPLPKKNEQ